MVVKKFKVAIIGSRTFRNYDLMKSIIPKIIYPENIELIVSGGASGADTLGERFADEHNITKMILPADWDKHGKKAGYLRNKDIVRNADIVIAFWDGISKGTTHSFKLCRDMKKQLYICRFLEPNEDVKYFDLR